MGWSLKKGLAKDRRIDIDNHKFLSNLIASVSMILFDFKTVGATRKLSEIR